MLHLDDAGRLVAEALVSREFSGVLNAATSIPVAASDLARAVGSASGLSVKPLSREEVEGKLGPFASLLTHSAVVDAGRLIQRGFVPCGLSATESAEKEPAP
jgi:NAD dependent epimerase/dehydratase family enzyme